MGKMKELDTFTLDCEYTDTFGGQANYCWVRRATLRDWASYRATQLLTRLDDAVTDAALGFTDFVIRIVRKLEN